MTDNSTPSDQGNDLNKRVDIEFALKAAQLGVWELDPVTNIVIWDEQCQALYGLPPGSQIPYQEALRFIHPDDVAGVDKAVQRAMNPQSDGYYEATYRTISPTDGRLRWVKFTGRSYFNEAGTVYRFAGVAQDVTPEKIRQQQLEENEERFRMLVERAPVAIATLRGEELIIETANSKVLEILHKPASIIGKPWLEALPELVGQPAETIIKQVYQTGEPFTVSEFGAQLEKDGQLVQGYYAFSYLPLTEGERVIGVMQVAIDITDQVVARQKILASEARFRTLIEQASVATCVFVGPEKRIEVANSMMIDFFGQGPAIVGRPVREVLTKEKGRSALTLLDEVFAGGQPYEAKAAPADLVICGIADTYYFDFSLKPLRNEAGDVYAVMETAVDVSQAVKDRQRLQASEERFQAAVAAVEGIVWTNSATGQMEGLQAGWAALTGQSYEEYQGYGWSKAIHPDDVQLTIDAWQQAVQERQTFLFEHRVRHYSGTWELYSIRAIPLFNVDGTVREWVGVHTNISEQRRAQQLIAESEARFRGLSAELEQQVHQRTGELQTLVLDLQRSNANLQQFAYIASHDLQEPLRKIQTFSDLLRKQHGQQLGEGAGYLERVQLAASRMSILIRDLLAYARISTHQDTSVPVSLAKLLDTTLEDLDLSIEETGATILVDPLPTILGDPVQLGQLFQNLLSNALKFRRPAIAPRIQIRCQLVAASSLPVTSQATPQATDYHLIEVIDNGIGFDDKYTNRIFQIFQRLHNRTDYTGTGIGLAICEKVVTNHGGAIWARSQPNQGATFSIYFPHQPKSLL